MAHSGKTFRIFVSSTFTDLKEERNALQKKVFPALKKLCTEAGCQFQAIDLRWGVSEEAGLDQRTMRICLEELERCRRTSPRPNFVLLLGDRYGWQPLPEVIPASEWNEILKVIESEQDEELLNNWYKKDNNAVPSVYELQPRTGDYADFEVWAEIEQNLRSALLKAVEKIELDSGQMVKYKASATEQEIIEGALKVEDARDHVLCFFRSIEDLPADSQAKDYLDLDAHGNPDTDARESLSNLKERLEEKLPENNIYKYSAKWTGGGISTEHINKLCDDVYSSLEKIISSEIEQIQEKPYLEKEIEDHDQFAEERARVFVGRADVLNRIGTYVDETVPRSLGIFGEGGSGKSALAAYALNVARSKYSNRAVIVSRFIGATISSSDGRSLLEDLCRQIALSYGQEADLPTAYEELVEEFPKIMALATADKPLIIFLDSLDQLTSAHNARSLTWLPEKLPENVRLVLTTRPGEYLVALRHKLPEENIIELGPLSIEEGGELLDRWLKEAGRDLQDFQRKEVLDTFSDCGWPLYLKLAFEEARLWKSYTKKVSLSPGHEGIIESNLFKRLEKEHSTTMVSRTLGYIAATRDTMGLAEDELLEILSSDQEFYNAFLKRAKHPPPEPKLPVAVWARLYFDLESYLTGKSHENTALFTFFHREIGEVAHKVYLNQDQAKYHRVLADYFMEKANPKVVSEKKENEQTWQGHPRALSELPYHLAGAEEWDRLFETMVDFNFLEEKTARVGVQENKDIEGNLKTSYTGALALLEDYDLALNGYPEE